MIRRALLAAALLLALAPPQAKALDIELLFDPDLTAYLKNTTGADIRLTVTRSRPRRARNSTRLAGTASTTESQAGLTN